MPESQAPLHCPAGATINAMRAFPFFTAVLWAVAAMLVACSPDEKRYVPNVGDGTSTPTMTTTDVSTLISDSGYTRYHLIAGVWQMFEDAEDPFWRFPVGLELEQYDDAMNSVATVVCDSAIYFPRRKLWQLDGNVVMVNSDADSFLTQQLFWNQNERKILSDSFIHIVRTDRIIEGYGFESDQSMRYYSVNRPTAILPVEGMRSRKGATKDTIPAPAEDDKQLSPSVPVRDLRKTSGKPADRLSGRPSPGKKSLPDDALALPMTADDRPAADRSQIPPEGNAAPQAPVKLRRQNINSKSTSTNK